MATTENTALATGLKILLISLILVGASIGGTLLYTAQTGAARAAESPALKPAVLPSPIFVQLEPFTVTLRDNMSSRILYVAVTLRVEDEWSRQQVTTYMPEVRNRALSELAMQDPNGVQTPDGRASLAKHLSEALKKPYQPQPTGPQISSVLFTAFVVQ